MDNKLSELSKPVAWLAIYHGDVYDEAISITRSVVEAQADRFGWESALTEITPLYSQEYVSALQHESAVNWEAAASLNVENQDLKKRIAELEAKLATPVRLPNKNDDEFWFDGVFQVAKFDRAVERAVSAAGFKFVGDE